MAEVYQNTNEDFEALRQGKEFLCPKCGHIIKPYPETAPTNKAHSFFCTYKNCDWYFHWDPAIDID